jgi:hypothetical protein
MSGGTARLLAKSYHHFIDVVYLHKLKYIILRIAKFLDFIHRPEVQKLARRVSETGTVSVLRWGRKSAFRCFYSWCHIIWVFQWFRWGLSKGHDRVGVTLPSPENGNRSCFRNVVLSQLFTIAGGRQTANSQYYILLYCTASSKRYRICANTNSVICTKYMLKGSDDGV